MNSVADVLFAHARIFGNSGPVWDAVYPAWNELFVAEGITADLLHRAVLSVFRRTAQPRWPSEHLSALREEIHQIRAHDASRREVEVVNAVVCRYCYDTGVVAELPHLCQIHGGEWDWITRGAAPYFTTAICDQCLVGRSRPRDIPEEKRLATLTEYASRNPRWRDHVRRWLASRRARSTAWTNSTLHDERIGMMDTVKKLANRIASRMGISALGGPARVVAGEVTDESANVHDAADDSARTDVF